MNKTYLIAFALLVLSALSIQATAETCDAPQANEEVRIYYANGMNNKEKDRELAKKALSDMAGPFFDYGLSVNHDEGPQEELLEAAEQKMNESSSLWMWMVYQNDAPQWYKDAYAQSMNQISNDEFMNDADLREIINEYLADLNAGKKVVIVAHSQGNLYANSAYRYIYFNHPEYRNNIGIVSIGTPANRIEGLTPAEAQNYYITNSLDTIINVVRVAHNSGLVPYAPLPANATADPSWDIANHNFLKTYMAFFEPNILDMVYNTINRLDSPPLAPQCEPGEVSTNSATPSATDAALNAQVTQGAGLSVWFNVRRGADPASCASTASGYPNTGPYSTGDPVTKNASLYVGDLRPNSMYYYRACAKNDPGDIGEGNVVSFRTKNAVATDVSTQAATDIDYTSATLNGVVNSGNYIDTWFVYGTSSNLACNAQYDGMGSKNTNDPHPEPVTDLNPDTQYYYKFCGKGYDGIDSTVGTSSFHTLVPGMVVSTITPSKCAGTINIGTANIGIWANSIDLQILSITHNAQTGNSITLPNLPTTVTINHGIDIQWSGPASDALTCFPLSNTTFNVTYSFTGSAPKVGTFDLWNVLTSY